MTIIPQGIGSFIRFLLGVVLLQGVAAVVLYTALQTDWHDTWPLFALIGAIVAVLAAFWFNSIVLAERHRNVWQVSERFSREREKIRVKAEQQRVRETRENARQLVKVRNRAALGTTLKAGVFVGGALGLGVAMMAAQFMTLGLVTLTAAGGALLGYGARWRQERRFIGRLQQSFDTPGGLIDVERPGSLLPRNSAKEAGHGTGDGVKKHRSGAR